MRAAGSLRAKRCRHARTFALPYGRVLLECDGGKLLLAHMVAEVAPGCVDLYLADVRVAAVLVVGQDRHLDEMRAQRLLLTGAFTAAALARRQDRNPSTRLIELLDVDLLQVMEGAAHTDRDL